MPSPADLMMQRSAAAAFRGFGCPCILLTDDGAHTTTAILDTSAIARSELRSATHTVSLPVNTRAQAGNIAVIGTRRYQLDEVVEEDGTIVTWSAMPVPQPGADA